jgi:hypothetical protein
MSPLVQAWMRRHSRPAGAPAAGERDTDAQKTPAPNNRARKRRPRPTTAPTPPAPRPRDQRRSTAPKLTTTQGRRRRQLPAATSAAPPPEQPAPVVGGRGQRDGATPGYEPPRTATAMAPQATHRTSATPPETSQQRSHPPPPSQHGARHRRVSRRTSPHTMPRSAGCERRSRGSRNPNHRFAPKSFRPTGKNRNAIAAVPSRSAHSHRNAPDSELIDKRLHTAGPSRHVATLDSHRAGHPAGRPDAPAG